MARRGDRQPLAPLRRAFRQLQENGVIRYEDLPLQTTDGSLREVEFVSNLYEEAGRHVIQCNIRDITDRKVPSAGWSNTQKQWLKRTA